MISEDEYNYLKFLYITDYTKFIKEVPTEKKQEFLSADLAKALNKKIGEVKIEFRE